MKIISVKEWYKTEQKGGPGSGNWEAPGEPRFAADSVEQGIGAEARSAVFDYAQSNTGGVEVAHIIANGKTVEVQGTQGAVSFTKEQAASMEYMVHNHPNSASFSCNDVAVLLQGPKLKRIDAVGSDGTLYSLEKTSDTNINPAPESSPSGFVSIEDLTQQQGANTFSSIEKSACKKWGSIKDKTFSKHDEKVASGNDASSVWKEHTHEIMKELAPKYGLKYTRRLSAFKPSKAKTVKNIYFKVADEDVYITLDDSSICNHPYCCKR